MRGLITLVSDNHVEYCLKEILAFIYYGLIVNNQPKQFRMALARQGQRNRLVVWDCL